MSDEASGALGAPETELRKMQKECFDRLRTIVTDYQARPADVVSVIQMIVQLQYAHGWVP